MNIIVRELYNYSVYAWYILYVLSFLGLYAKAPEYLTTVDLILRVYVSLFLIIRFNPYRKIHFTEFDRKIIFSAGIFLILSTTITSIFVSKIQANASERAQRYLNQIINNNDDNDIDIDN
jgi:hypothetical protein